MEIQPAYQTALKAAVDASHEIMHIYTTAFETIIKDDGSPVTAADIASSNVINKALQTTGIPIIGEEIEDAPYSERAHWEKTWVVDPLDGTKEFIKRNGEFAVNIALVENRIPIVGIIASPVNQTILFGGPSIGAYILNFSELDTPSLWRTLEPQSINDPIVMAGSRSHHSGSVLALIHRLRAQFSDVHFIKKGSSLKFFDLAEGRADVYPRFAPTMEWDIAAGQAILNALGGDVIHAEHLVPLEYNKANLTNPYFIAYTQAFKAEFDL